MKKKTSILKKVIGSAGFFFLVSCAATPHLQLTYRLPGKEKALSGQKAFVTTEDIRKDNRLFAKGARQKFEKTSEDIALFIAKGTEAGVKKGVYNPSVLLKEALESRLRHEGVVVVPEGASAVGISLLLRSFLLDRMDRKWRVNMAFEIQLMKSGKMISSEIISGEAERFELVGKEQAEVVLGELFSEVVNRVDLDKLFDKAG